MDVNNIPLETCELSSIFCRAQCSCDSGYFGYDCSIAGSSELASVQALRDEVCLNLEIAAEIQEMSPDVFYARILSITNTVG